MTTQQSQHVNVPDTLKTVAFIENDTKRFPNTHECGFACHTTVSTQDYIFTAYPKR